MSDHAATQRELALLDRLETWSDTLDELADLFRATAGSRPASLAYVYGDVASGLRAHVRGHRALIDAARDAERADHPAAGGRPEGVA